MMRRVAGMALAAAALMATAGCVRTVATVATAPVKAAGKVVDWSTTSPSEADRKYARKMRKREEYCRKYPDAAECEREYGERPR